MDYPIALPPDLGLSPADFVDAWNDTPACRAVAEAHLVESTGTQYDPTLLAATFAVLGSVAVGVAASALYDCIKQALAQKGIHKRTELMQLDQPDGSRLLVIKIIEES